ncbi:MAG: ribulokinase [Spirochaetaceae bacterium]|jgi:L-ribulokinase|nr:ribulokinase [Spirochaetaceae bacterium]
MRHGEHYVLGLDYGSDSCRAVLVDAATGEEVGVSVMPYPRWTQGLYCDPARNQFRQHPQDYQDTLIGTVRQALARAPAGAADKIRGIALDTTGSTPCLVDEHCTPLSLTPHFADNPAALFILWKDHSAVAEAALLNEAAHAGATDWTQFVGGIYSAEWFWAKTMRAFKEDATVAEAAASTIEHCDWMTALLTGTHDLAALKRSRCAMGHKALWHRTFGGYPPASFFVGLDSRLEKIRASLGTQTYTSDQSAGPLCEQWADLLGIQAGIPVAVGAYDAHMGAVGGGVGIGRLVRVMGTSTCDITVGYRPHGPEKPVRGICGQVDGSVIPGFIGYEAGQSSFGDVYAWFRDLLLYPVHTLLPEADGIALEQRESIRRDIAAKLIPRLEEEAAKIDPAASALTALDWLNGRRSPDANQKLSAALTGLTLGSSSPEIYRALAHATAFGARAIVERFNEEGVPIKSIIGIGGVARKSPLIMQILADSIGMPLAIPAHDQTVALGAAIFAAVAAGLYPDLISAQQALASPVEKTYSPNQALKPVYDTLYRRYRELGEWVEGSLKSR